MKRTRVVAAKTALAGGVVALGLAGCSVTNPAVIKDPYPASDGIHAELPGTDVLLRNLVVIGAEKGAEAELIGSVINQGTADARVSLQAAVGESGQPSQTTVAVGAGQTVQFGPGENQTPVSITDLAVAPGALTGLTASTESGGRVDLSVPVLPPEGDYADVTPAAAPSTAPTEAPGSTGRGQEENAEGTPTAGAGDDPTEQSNAEKTDTPQRDNSDGDDPGEEASSPEPTTSN